jgi:hypothetical protein
VLLKINQLLLLLPFQDMEGACHCSVQPLAAGDSDEDELEQQQQVITSVVVSQV